MEPRPRRDVENVYDHEHSAPSPGCMLSWAVDVWCGVLVVVSLDRNQIHSNGLTRHPENVLESAPESALGHGLGTL
jgi:hypothetical protein